MKYSKHTLILSLILLSSVVLTSCNRQASRSENRTAVEAVSADESEDSNHSCTTDKAGQEKRAVDSTSSKKPVGRIITGQRAGAATHKARRLSNGNLADLARRTVSKFFSNADSDTLCVGRARLAVPREAMAYGKVLSITPLRREELPELPTGMVNVTGGCDTLMTRTDTVSGYRFLPHGNHFIHHLASISVPYDSTLIPKGYTADDIHTYYYDGQHRRWTMLQSKGIDTRREVAMAETSHFTDVINGIIKVPESPETQNYVPTGISELRAADPAAGIRQIEAPSANQNGTASLSYPFETPAGRNDISAGAGLQYSSDGGSSFVGYGWSLPMQSIDIETRWGVPRFDEKYESESYLLMGQQLSDRLYRRTDSLARQADKTFRPMVEGSFSKIVRRGNSPKNYYWEVTAKDGTVYSYGGYDGKASDESSLTDGNGNRIKWALTRVTDVHGNFAAYHYIKCGNNLYPSRYTWTGYGKEEGLYSITFDIDTVAAGRKDVVSSGRLGVLQRDHALLRKVTVLNDGQQLRAYLPHYEEGPFGKTLLTAMDQLDSKDNVVATQRFDYYNDVKNGMFSDSLTIYTAPHDEYGKLVKNKIGHFDDTLSLLGGSSAKGNTVGGGVMVGAGWGPASTNAGASYSHTKSKNEGRIALVDINGDGLPDKVWRGTDRKLHYRLNQNADMKHPSFGEDHIAEGVSSFSSGTTTSNSWDANVATGFGPASAGYAVSKGKDQSKTQVYFQDFNNDGLTDIAVNGTVYFNHSDGEHVTFSPSSTETGNHVLSASGTSAIDSTFIPDYRQIRDSLEQEHPLHDVVRVWRAPYAGTVSINSQIAKPSAAGDGVSLSIQQNSAVLWQDTLLQGGTVTPKTLSRTVRPGDYLVFRVGARYSGEGDAVTWDPSIVYTSIKATACAGADITHYKSSKDYVEGEYSTVALSDKGGNRFESTISKQKTSDDILLTVVKTDKDGNQTTVDSLLLGADSVISGRTFSGAITAKAEEAATVDFIMRTGSPVDWQKVSWKPVFYADTTKYALAPQRLMFCKNIVLAADTSLNAAIASKDTAWSKGIKLVPELRISRASDKDKDAATVHLTVKDDRGSLLYRKELTIGSNNRLSADTIRIDDAAAWTRGKVQVTYSMANELNGATARLHILRDSVYQYMAADSTLATGTKTIELDAVGASVYSSYNRFDLGQLYKGWGSFAWNSTERFAAIEKEDMRTPENNKYYHDGKIDDAAVESGDMDINRQQFFAMSYQPQTDTYRSATDSAYVSSTQMRPSRLGEDDIVVDSVNYDMQGSGLSAPVLLTETKSKGKTYNLGFSLGVSAGVNKSQSKEESYTKVSAMDLNGDGYPDWLSDKDGKVLAQLTQATGTLSSERLLYDVENASTKGEASNIGADMGLSTEKDAYSLKDFNDQMTTAKAAFAQGVTTTEIMDQISSNGKNASHSGKQAEFACSASGNFSSGSSHTVTGWEDLNGDGLPDIVTDGKVRYGLGYGYTAEQPSYLSQLENSINSNYGDGLGICIPVLGLFSINGGQNDTESLSSTRAMLRDVNGDGLPDLLSIGRDGGLTVTLNSGNGFKDETATGFKASLSDNLGSSVALYASVAYTYTIPLPFGFRINITPSVQGSHSESISRTTASVMDMDGDGLPDLVYSGNEDWLLVRRNLTGRTNMLRSVTLPFGGHINIGYGQTVPSYDNPGRKWVMTSVETTGGYKENGATSSKSTFEYGGGYRDRRERDFYGFRTVRTNQLDTENGDNLYRYSVQTFGNNRDYYAHSLVTDESLYDAEGRKLQGAVYGYDMKKIKDGKDSKSESVIFPALATLVQSNFDEQSGDSLSTRIANEYDAYGNLVGYKELAASTELDATINYHELKDKYIVSVPSHITVSSGGKTYRERSTTVDGNGEITAITLHNGDTPSVYDMDYDAYGNIVKMTKPENYRHQRMFYAYTYDDRYHSLVTSVKDAYGYSSSTEYNPLWNAPSSTTDLNGQRMEYTYDDLGRLATVRAPYEIESGQRWTIKFEYSPEQRRAHTIHYTQDGNIDTYTFADSLMRAVQTKQTGVIWQDGREKTVSIVSGRARSDAFGRAVAAFYPEAEDISSIEKYNTSTGDPQSTTEYDSHDRTTAVTLADGSMTKSAYAVKSHDGEPMLETTVTDALGRHAESYTDERGRNRETVQHANGDDVTVKYDYYPVGQVMAVTHPNGHQTTYSYDLLGRKLMVNHPDAGETDMTYDAAGNLLTKLTAQLRKSISDKGYITYTYDFERLKEVLYPENLFNRVTYTYGEAGDKYGRAGRLALVEDASGGEAYYYGKQGEVTKTVRTVMASTADIRTYVYGATYDSWNRVRTMTYPDGEVVTYHYNAAGQINALTSNKLGKESVIVSMMGYDKDGHTVYTKLGNGTETTYAYDKQRQRLQNMTLTDGGSVLMKNKYQYDAVDNILGITNAADPMALISSSKAKATRSSNKSVANINKANLGGASHHSYEYDDLNRLIHASGKAKNASYDMAMTFGLMSEPLTKVQKVDSSRTAKSYDFAYKYEDANHPTAPTQIGQDHYTYDADGNPILVINDSTNTERKMYWDEDDRLMVLSDNGRTSRYTYNAAGDRIIKSHGTMEGVYINGAPQGITFHETDDFTLYPASILTVSKGRFTKHYFIGSQRIASRIGTGSFNNVYGRNNSYVTAGQQDYAQRMADIEGQREEYYKQQGIAPGVPTEKGAYGDPENTGVGYNSIITELGDHSVPDGWIQTPKHNDEQGSNPCAPISWNNPSTPDDPEPGYGYISDDTTSIEDTYFFHSDHLGSTSYITDANGNVTQYDAYLPYGELLVDEHSSSEDMPYKFNGKEFDEETGLYYYGARYMDPTTGIWYGADAFVEAKPQYASYLYCEGNPINLTDSDGNWERNASGNLVAQRGDNAVSYAKYTGMSNAQALAVFKANGVVPDENNILNLKVGQEISNGSYYLGDITVLGTRGISVNKNKSSNRYDVSLLHTSAKGVEFVKDREGLTGKENGYVYDDPKGFATFGVGHLLHRSGYTRSDVNYWTNRLKGNRNLINDVLKQDLKSTEATVKRLVKVPLAQNEFDAIVSFTFNVGPKGLQKSQFLKSLNKGVYNGNLMLRYLRPRKLKDRREKEVALFNHGKYN